MSGKNLKAGMGIGNLVELDATGKLPAVDGSQLTGIGSGGLPAGLDTQIQFNNANAFGASANFVWDHINNRLGIGTTPTAKLHLPAGTAVAGTAPIKLTSGAALGTKEDGVFEYHTSHLYFTIGSTRYQLDQQSGVAGANTQIQFNNLNSFGASQNLTWDGTGINVLNNLIPTEGFSASSSNIGVSSDGATFTLDRTNITNNVNGFGFWLQNGTAATALVPEQYSPGQLFIGYAWDTTSSTSIQQGFYNYVKVNSGASTSSNLIWASLGYPDIMNLSSAGTVYIGGNTDGTALLHLAPGTAVAAPLKFTTGVELGTPEDGALEYDTSHLWFTVGAIRYQLDQQAAGANSQIQYNNSGVFGASTDLIWTGGGLSVLNSFYPSDYSNLTAQGLTISSDNTIVQINRTNLETSIVNQGLELANYTDATLGVPVQNSPTFMIIANAWNTTTTLSEQKYFVCGVRATSGATTKANMVWASESTGNIMNISSSGKLYIGGATTGTALLHLAPGTLSAGTAPIKLTSGAAMSVTEDGAFEYHTSHLYFTIGSTRYQLDQQGASPAGLNTQVQFNNSLAFGASSDFTWDGTGVSVGDVTTTGSKVTKNSFNMKNSTNVAISLTCTGSTAVAGVAQVGLMNNDGGAGIQLNTFGSGQTTTTFGQSPVAKSNVYSSAGSLYIGTGSTGVGHILAFGTLDVLRANFNGTNGNLYIGDGTTSGTALLHLKAGTLSAGTAPIKLTSGAAMSTAEDGAIEYYGSHLYFTIGATRYQLDQQGGASQAVIAALAIDWTVAQYRWKSVTADQTFTFSGASDAKCITIEIISDTSAHNIAFPAGIKWANTGAVVLANKRNLYTFVQINGDIIGNAVIDAE